MASLPQPAEIMFEVGGFESLDAITAVMDAAFDPRFGEAWSRSQCAGIMPMRGVELLLAREGAGGPVRGFALWRTIIDDSELLLLAVDPGLWGKGLGRLLLDAFVNAGRGRGVARLHLEVRDGNRATRLYEKAGFRIMGRRLDYYSGAGGERHDALTYMLID